MYPIASSAIHHNTFTHPPYPPLTHPPHLSHPPSPIDPSPPTLATIPRPPPTLLLRPPPSLLISALGLRLWHKRDDQFALPKAIVHAQVSSAALHASPRHIALAVLCHNLLENSLSEVRVGMKI